MKWISSFQLSAENRWVFAEHARLSQRLTREEITGQQSAIETVKVSKRKSQIANVTDRQ